MSVVVSGKIASVSQWAVDSRQVEASAERQFVTTAGKRQAEGNGWILTPVYDASADANIRIIYIGVGNATFANFDPDASHTDWSQSTIGSRKGYLNSSVSQHPLLVVQDDVDIRNLISVAEGSTFALEADAPLPPGWRGYRITLGQGLTSGGSVQASIIDEWLSGRVHPRVTIEGSQVLNLTIGIAQITDIPARWGAFTTTTRPRWTHWRTCGRPLRN